MQVYLDKVRWEEELLHRNHVKNKKQNIRSKECIAYIYKILDTMYFLEILDTLYIQETYLVWNKLIRQRKRKSGRSLQIDMLIAEYNVSLYVDKHILFSIALYGHFALDSISKTYIGKHSLSDKYVYYKENIKNETISKCRFRHQSQQSIITRHYFVSINTFRYM